MLDILRRVFDFSDWQASHPRDVPPGDMLDASFDAQDAKINELVALISSLQRSDGALSNGIVTWDSFSSDLKAKIIQEIALRAADFANSAQSAASEAVSASISAKNSEINALEAADEADSAKIEVVGTSNDVLAQVQGLIRDYEQGLQALRSAEASLLSARTDFDDGGAMAEAWARSSMLWAEHMPDTLPDNAVKIMDISGDHWSARWWANRADNAFGRLTDLYLGAWPEPPLTNLEGGPIEVGSIYYDTDPAPGQMYVWDGTQWNSMTQPQRAAVATLWYSAVAGQTVFPLTVPDVYGHNFTISSGFPEALNVYVNGVKLMPYVSPLGDWTVNNATSTVTLERPVRLEDLVSFDIFLPDEKLATGAVQAWALAPITGKDGVKTTFALATAAAPGVPVLVGKAEELVVSLDGVLQEPGVSYTASGANITFASPPGADSHTFITWLQPAAVSSNYWLRWSGTQAAYDAIAVKDPNTLYVVTA